MKVKGLPFRDDEVRAIREGRKTLTSLLCGLEEINRDPDRYARTGGDSHADTWSFRDARRWNRDPLVVSAPLSPGDVAYVREAWRPAHSAHPWMNQIFYRADRARSLGMYEYSSRHKWWPCTHMRRSQSRLTLPVVEVWPARVQDTTPADAIAEGILPSANFATIDCDTPSPVDGFRSLWNSLYAKPKPIAGGAFGDALCYVSYPFSGESRDETYRGKPHHICANPWRWCVRFRVVEANVDEYLRSAAA